VREARQRGHSSSVASSRAVGKQGFVHRRGADHRWADAVLVRRVWSPAASKSRRRSHLMLILRADPV